MDFPFLTNYYFSAVPDKEKACRRLCWLLCMGMSLLLIIFWHPLRSTELTYPMVSFTITNTLVYAFFRVVTTLGSEGFFLVLLAVIYWSVNKAVGFWGLIVMPTSIFLTSEVLKDIIRLPRPDIRGIAVPTYTFPSGHTSGALSVWGYLAIIVKKRWVWIWTIVIVSLVALSRIMLGYHFPGDVLGGIVTGTIFLALFFGVGVRLIKGKWYRKVPNPILLFLALAVPLLISFAPVTLGPNLMGYLAGASAGYVMQRGKLNFLTRGSWQEHLARALIGLPVLAILIPGMQMILPSNFQLLIFIQHALATFWIIYVAPLLFVKLGLLRS